MNIVNAFHVKNLMKQFPKNIYNNDDFFKMLNSLKTNEVYLCEISSKLESL